MKYADEDFDLEDDDGDTRFFADQAVPLDQLLAQWKREVFE
jgi:hypothetical protein